MAHLLKRGPMRLTVLLAAFALATPAPVLAAPISDARQLTFEGKRAGEGYFSADGSKLIFQSERDAANPFYQIYTLDLETGDVDRVSPGDGKTTCAWLHPTGKRALYASTQFDPAAKAKMQAELDFRASGKSRRYAWDYDPAFEIVEVDLATGAYKRLTDAEGYDAEGSYSPDGQQIAFASNRLAYAGTLSAEDAERLERDPAFFSDIYIMNADGSGLKQLTQAPGYDGGPFFSADGKKIVWRRFSEDGARAEIFTMNSDGTDERQITSLGAMSWAPYFHPSGDYIVFATNLQGFANFELYLVDANGEREPVRLTDRAGFDGLPTFTPDGKRISWTSNATPKKQSQIFIANWDHVAALDLVASAPLRADAGPSATDGTSTAIAAVDLERHVAALASEDMAGRLTGTDGAALATAYVASAFAEIDLAPAGDDGGYFQAFDFTAGIDLAPGNLLDISVDGKSEALALDQSWRPLAFSAAGAAKKASVLFAGYGLVAPADGDAPAFDSYGDLDATGKWVLIWRGMPYDVSAERRSALSRYADLRYKAAVAKSRGAIGVIFAPPPRDTFADTLPRLAFEAAAAGSNLAAVAVDRNASARMLSILGDDLAAMTARIENGEADGRDLIGVETGGVIALTVQRRQGRNVIGRLDLDGKAEGGLPPLVIGAHVDHLGKGETSGSRATGEAIGQVHFGADDNASGVAAIIEVAQKLAADHKSGKLKAVRDIVFAAWSGEELGLLGATHYVDAAIKQAAADDLKGVVSAYLNLDMVGRLRDKLTVAGLASSSVWAGEIERRNAVVGLPITASDNAYLPTDSTAFYLNGAPILSFFTGVHDEYHTPRDTADTLNYAGLEDVAKLVALIARSRARDAVEPEYVKVERPAGSGGRRMSKVFLGTIPDYAGGGGDAKGVPLSGVVQAGPAEKAGVAGGDVMVGLAGQDIETIYDFVRTLNGLKPGEEVDITVLRDGARKTLRITPGARE